MGCKDNLDEGGPLEGADICRNGGFYEETLSGSSQCRSGRAWWQKNAIRVSLGWLIDVAEMVGVN